jgi:hypothetical protein
MRKAALVIVLGLCVAGVGAGPAAAGPSTGEGTIKGRVFDRTCPGPCSIDGERRPFDGEATVEIYRVPGHELYGSAKVEDSRFHLLAPPGTYRVRVIPYPDAGGNCWEGSSRKVTLKDTETVRVRLTVENVCVV